MKLFYRVILVFLTFCGCSRDPNSLVYVFPDNFHGIFIFRGNSPKGESVKRVKYRLQLTIPPSGVLELQGKLPIRDWNIVSAQFASGESIPIYDSAANIATDVIALRRVGSTNMNEEWFVVGTYEDAVRAHEKLRGFKWNFPQNK